MSNKDNTEVLNKGNNELPSHPCKQNFSGEVKKGTNKVSTKKIGTNSNKISYGNVDKRVSLTVAPKLASRNESETLFVNKVKHVLGPKFYTNKNVEWLTTSKFYGLLRNALGSTSGLIFPYTPSISFQHNVNYETSDVIHSNISYNYYKNSPPPTISLSGKFTADNRDNALHMLSAIWFCIACSKCEFGEKTENPGLPPPIIYLSGYDHLIDNIPVVISSINYKYPENLHYVNLVLDMSKDYNNNEAFCKIYDSYSTYETTKEHIPDGYRIFGKTDFFGEPVYEQDDPNDNYSKSTSIKEHKDGITMSYWLPTELTLSLGLKIQPNLLKTRKQWFLDGYKTSLLMTNNSKNTLVSMTSVLQEQVEKPLNKKEADSNGKLVNMCTFELKDKKVTSNIYDFIPSGWTW